MDIFATLIVPASKVQEARADGSCSFSRALSVNGQTPATHYVSSGKIPEESVAALASICAITTGAHDPYQVISDAGLQFVVYPSPH